jgi:hypothetical protein
MGDGWIFLKISVPLSLINTYQMNLISAGSISLDSTFKEMRRRKYKIRKLMRSERRYHDILDSDMKISSGLDRSLVRHFSWKVQFPPTFSLY